MKVWTVVNQKGGVGKTTSVVTLAGLLAARGKRVLMVDTDPHASLGYYLGLDPEELPASLFDLFIHHDQLSPERCSLSIVPTQVEGLDLLPAATALATLDRRLGNQPGMGFILQKILGQLRSRYDYVLIDCPPVLGVLMVNALAACDRIIVPVQTEYLALKGLDRMIQTLQRMAQGKRRVAPHVIVPTMFDRRTKASLLALAELARSYPQQLWHSVIPVDTRFRDASLAHLPAPQFAGASRGVTAYNELLNFLDQEDGANVAPRATSG
ncbi:ParA family protein [Ferrimonas marina]|uniref:Chromosome partitioning protein n=1 Tax=Ferrimonas marina TaxID=299255 RepID=A0A1M5YE31_9GAMM|nr:ParA family protein [Ferrimonas marina]SHI10321.1 chromosome partitioning protein [Ferrimonas marina]